jgi:hypothetical protein
MWFAKNISGLQIRAQTVLPAKEAGHRRGPYVSGTCKRRPGDFRFVAQSVVKDFGFGDGFAHFLPAKIVKTITRRQASLI